MFVHVHAQDELIFVLLIFHDCGSQQSFEQLVIDHLQKILGLIQMGSLPKSSVDGKHKERIQNTMKTKGGNGKYCVECK